MLRNTHYDISYYDAVYHDDAVHSAYIIHNIGEVTRHNDKSHKSISNLSLKKLIIHVQDKALKQPDGI